MKRIALLLIIASIFLTGCVTTQSHEDTRSGGYQANFNIFESSDWIDISAVELYQDDDFLYLILSYVSDGPGEYSIFNPPDGDQFKKLGTLVEGKERILQEIKKSNLEGIEGLTVLLFTGDTFNDNKRTGLFIKQEEFKWNLIPRIPTDLIVAKSETPKESPNNAQEQSHSNLTPEEFKASHPWFDPKAVVINNPDFKAGDLYSSKYLVLDVIDIPLELNPEYVGEWKAYGNIDHVNLPFEEINAHNLYSLFKKNGDLFTGNEKESNWRGIRFLEDGIVESDSGIHLGYKQYAFWGTKWTDGWIISEERKTRSHSIIFDGEDTLLFFELKNGDYDRGSAPYYVVFKKL